jgi:hypothetical protein
LYTIVAQLPTEWIEATASPAARCKANEQRAPAQTMTLSRKDVQILNNEAAS